MMPTQITVPVKLLEHAVGLPPYSTNQSACVDLYAAVKEPYVLESGQRGLIPTGLSFAIPFGWEAQIRPRSGLALKQGITVLNSPGVIDADYRGEVFVLLINHGPTSHVIRRGDRIAQCIFTPAPKVYFELQDTLPVTSRDSGGFGSTGC